MPTDPIWWLALAVQILALPGVVLPVLPGLLWLPLGAGLWCWHAGWASGWPALLLACLVFGLGSIADLLALALATAKLQASRWSALGAGAGVLIGVFTGGFGLLIAPWLGAAVVEAWSLQQRSPQLSWSQRIIQAARVGLAVVVGLLVSQLAQLFLVVVGIVGFVLLSVH